jgi:hypothetical protein
VEPSGEEVEVIRHQAIDWHEEMVEEAHVGEVLAKSQVKLLIQPAGGAVLHGHGPMHDGLAAIPLRRETA